MHGSGAGRGAPVALTRFPAAILTALLLAACQAETAGPERAQADLPQLLAEADQAVQKGDFGLADRLIEAGLDKAQAQGDAVWTWKFRLVSSERRIRNEEFEKALEILDGEVPETAGSPSLRARVALNRARACLQLKRQPEAEALLDQAERLAGPEDPGLPIDILNRRALLKVNQGDQKKAVELFQEAYRRAVGSGVPRLEMEAVGNLGWFFERVASRPDQAIPYYEKALETALQTGDKVSIVRAKTNLGWCHNKLGNFDRALEEIKSAIPLAMEAGVPDLDNTLAGIGAVYQYLNDYENALDYYHRALRLATDSGSRADWSYNVAFCHIERGEWDLAQKFNQQAIANRNPDSPEELAYPQVASAEILMGQGRLDEAKAILVDLAKRAVSFSDPVPLWETYATLGRLASERGDLQEADGMYQLALGRLEAARRNLQEEEWQISFHSLWNHFAKSYVDLLVARGQSDRALERAEANRALVLSEKLGVAAGRGSSAGFMEAARRLDATLLAYWLAPKRSFLWAVTGSAIRRVDLPPAREIENLVEGHQNRVMAAQTKDARDPFAVRLYEVLVAPVEDLLTSGGRIVVVPDGRLHELNFETLQTPGERSKFLIQDVTVAVAHSLPLLQAEPGRAGAPKSLLLVGDPVAVDPSFPPLRGAKAEIKAVAQNFAPEQTTTIVRENATPQAYLEASPGDYALIHFTAHAVANTVNPLSSAVILSPREGAYRLFARDVAENRLAAAVVTLSACRSAGAKTYSGEGLVGFAWAFLEAGAQNVVAGLWDVDDRASAELMAVYYRQLALGRSPADALREAKLDLLSRGAAYRNPYYWAPFQIYTRSSPFGVPPATLAFRR